MKDNKFTSVGVIGSPGAEQECIIDPYDEPEMKIKVNVTKAIEEMKIKDEIIKKVKKLNY